jgi:hypothetical protein
MRLFLHSKQIKDIRVEDRYCFNITPIHPSAHTFSLTRSMRPQFPAAVIYDYQLANSGRATRTTFCLARLYPVCSFYSAGAICPKKHQQIHRYW